MKHYFLPLTDQPAGILLTSNRIFGIILFVVGVWNLIHPVSARKVFASWNRKNVHIDEKNQRSTRLMGVGCMALGVLIFFL